MQMNEIYVNRNLMETTPHKSLELPMQVYADSFEDYILKYINWHWHNEFEFSVILTGTVKFLVEDAEIVLTAGDGIFLNAATLHQVEPLSAPSKTQKFDVLCAPSFIASFDQGNIFDKYVKPVLLNPSIKHFVFQRSILWQRKVLDHLFSIYQADTQKAYGYELLYHSVLFHVWRLLVLHTDVCSNADMHSAKNQVVRERVNGMIDFIKKNYSQDLSVQTIANHVNISKSESFRCFQSCTGSNPYAFLQKYRLERAVILLCTTKHSVAEIASLCGFNSPSHFGMMFKKAFGITPVQYRGRSAAHAAKTVR